MPPTTSHNRRASDHGETEHEQLTALLSDISQRLAPIEYFIENYEAMCPHRELLARAANNIVSMNAMKESLARVRLDVAKYGVLAGLIGAVVVAAAMAGLGL